MKKIFEVLVKPSRLILLITSIVYICLYMVSEIGSIGGGFLGVLGEVIILVLTLAALISIPVLLLLKKEEAAKIVFILVGGYWLITSNQSYLFFGNIVANNKNGLLATTGVFGFLVGLALAAVLVLLVLHFILKKEVLKFAAILTYALAFLFLFVFFILYFIIHIQNQYPWTSYLDLFARLVAAIAIFFGYLYFLGAPEYEFPKRAPKEEKPVEKQEEPAPAEEPAQAEVEAVPAEESPEEEKPE